MKIIKHLTIGLLLAGAIALSNCKKEGPIGPAGPAGKDGVNGQDGKGGNANVKSISISIPESEWIFFTKNYASVTKQIPEITADIVNKGVVMVYAQEPEGPWFALPFSFAAPGGLAVTCAFSIETGMLHLYFTWNTTDDFTAENFYKDYRIAVISADDLARNPNMDVNDLNQVETFLTD